MPANEEILEGEIEPESTDPALVRVGTLAWLRQQDVVDVMGVMLPCTHRVPEDATLAEPSADTHCRVIYADGHRCKGTRLLAYGLCMGHVGGGGSSDPAAMGALGATKLRELRVTRQLLGIGPRTAGSPRAAARLRAAQRAQDFAQAIVDGPLDADLGPLDRQRAALAALDATFPLQSGTIEVALTDDPASMDWKSMQELAASLLS